MANIETVIDEWSVRDLEDNSSLNIRVVACTELGNQGKPGIQVYYVGHIINYEPLATERWAYEASKSNSAEYLIKDYSWIRFEDQYVKNYLVPGSPLKIRVEAKTRSSKPVIKEYTLPFEV